MKSMINYILEHELFSLHDYSKLNTKKNTSEFDDVLCLLKFPNGEALGVLGGRGRSGSS